MDGRGVTLYVFTRDEQGASVCYEECAAAWPALTGGVEASDGVDPAKLGTVARDDGPRQVTYNGRPLYYFAGDESPGDIKGQGLNDVWFAVSPTGKAIGTRSRDDIDLPTGDGY